MNTSPGKVSRKGKVKVAYHEQGQEVAWTLGHKLKLKPSTLRTWISTWRREAAAQASPKAKVAKPKVKDQKVEDVVAEKKAHIEAGERSRQQGNGRRVLNPTD